MWKNMNKPDFGVLDGLKVVHSATNMAGPMGATMLADHGADLIWLENPRIPDTSRSGIPLTVEVERRNCRTLALDIPSPQGKEIFRKILEDADIYIEGWKPGTLAKWGLSDEVLWSWNPKLIIVHVSGYGQNGDPEYYTRGGYDAIGQAASGFMNQNHGAVAPFSCDAQAAMYIAFSALAAYYRACKTGKGESIDLSQVEIMMRQQLYLSDYATNGRTYGDESKKSATIAGWGPFVASDGQEVYVVGIGGNTMRKGADWLGLKYGSELNPEGNSIIAKGTAAGDEWDRVLTEYIASVPAATAEKELLAHSIPCTRIMTYEDVLNTEHWKMRGTFTTYKSSHGYDINSVAPMPHMANRPGQVWRGAPSLGMDNEEILGELGFTEEEIKKMYDDGVINKRPVEDFRQ